MSTSETFQIPIEAAEAYEARFVPAIFAEWAPRVLDAASVKRGSRVLDVACGTGIVARTAFDRIGDTGTVVGLDLNESMLAVARRVAPEIDWRRGDALDLPFDDESFDAVACQMAMMFFPERRPAFAEMRRVLAPGGLAAVVVPASIDAQPAYGVFVDAVVSQAGDQARSLLGTYWACGDLDELATDATAAGLDVVARVTIVGSARFESAADFVATEIAASPLSEQLDETDADCIIADVRTRLGEYETSAGFAIPLVGHVLTCRR